MKLSGTGEAFLADVRWRILGALDLRGPLTVAELPRGWPVTRVVLRHVVEELVDEGAVETVSGSGVPGRAALRITPLGRSRLRGAEGAAD